MARAGSRSHPSSRPLWLRNFLEQGQKAGKGHDYDVTLTDEEEYLLDRVGDFAASSLLGSQARPQLC